MGSQMMKLTVLVYGVLYALAPAEGAALADPGARALNSLQHAKRNVLQVTKRGVTIGTFDEQVNTKRLERRDDENFVSSCGDHWTPIRDPGWSLWGYLSAATSFCNRVYTDDSGNPMLIPAGIGYASSNIVFEDDLSNDGKRVTLKDGVSGYIEFEIHNKSDREYRVIKEECIEAMMAMTMVGSDCYGEDNEDTKGGTYQKGSIESGISFHGLPKEGMPAR